MQINCDLGESFGAWQMGRDEELMPLLQQANIACGFHAGDPSVIRRTLLLAKQHNVAIGAHPSYPDLAGFGRRSMAMSAEQLIDTLLYQIAALDGMAASHDLDLVYVKPHGALYNDMMRDPKVLTAVLQALAQYHRPLKLMVQSLPDNQATLALAAQWQVSLLFEVFADRAYEDDGRLRSRQHNDAVLSPTQASNQVARLLASGEMLSVTGKVLTLAADSICVHGDGAQAYDIARAVHLLVTNSARE